MPQVLPYTMLLTFMKCGCLEAMPYLPFLSLAPCGKTMTWEDAGCSAKLVEYIFDT